MKIRHELTYEASPAEVYAMRADPVFRERACEAMGTLSHDVRVDDTGSVLVVVVDMVQPTHGMPSLAKQVVGDRTRVVQTERWASAGAGDIEVAIPGKPGHIRGWLSLSDDAAGSVYVFEGEVTIKVPLVGRRLGGLVEKLFIEGMETEQRVAAAWLKGQRS